jgi:hypothetical protein
MIFISLPPFGFFYYSMLLSVVTIAQGMPEQCDLIFQEVAIYSAVFLLHEGRKILLRKGGSGTEKQLNHIYNVNFVVQVSWSGFARSFLVMVRSGGL